MAVTPDSESPKRVAIIDAATDLFAARGYGAVSMDAVARAADVSKATLYAYFGSKDELFATIVSTACRENLSPEGELPDGGGDVEAALTAIGGRILRFFLRERSLAIHRLVVAESGRFPELGRAFYDNGPASSRAMLADWMARLDARNMDDPRLAAEQFLALLRTGLYLRATLGLVSAPDEAEIDAAVRRAVRTIMRAFGLGRDGGHTGGPKY